MKKDLNKLFEGYVKKVKEGNKLLVDKQVFQKNYIPDELFCREKQIEELAKILAPSLRLEKPDNVMIYGKEGVGKTCVARYVTQQMEEVAKINKLNLKIVYLNCKTERVADTEYRLFAELVRALGGIAPVSGIPTMDVFDFFIRLLEERELILIIILDEIDHLVKKIDDEVLYTLIRINSELRKSKISIIGISVDITIPKDPRLRHLIGEEIILPPYDALQLQKILQQRVNLGFKEGALEDGVINKCAAYVAKESGSAGMAIEMLKTTGDLAEKRKRKKVLIKDLDDAKIQMKNEKIKTSTIRRKR